MGKSLAERTRGIINDVKISIINLRDIGFPIATTEGIKRLRDLKNKAGEVYDYETSKFFDRKNIGYIELRSELLRECKNFGISY